MAIRQRTVTLALVLALVVAGSSYAAASKGGGKGADKGGSKNDKRALVVVVDDGVFGSTTQAAIVALADGTTATELTGEEYDLRATCSQDDRSVFVHETRTVGGRATIPLGPTAGWPSGNATCVAEHVVRRGRRWHVSARSPFLAWDPSITDGSVGTTTTTIPSTTTTVTPTTSTSVAPTTTTATPTTTTIPVISTTVPTTTSTTIPVITTTTTIPVITTTTTIPVVTTTTTPALDLGGAGFVMPTGELLSKPMSGAGWTLLTSAADSSWGEVDLGNQNSLTQSYVLAGALVYARSGDTAYRDKVIDHVRRACGTHRDGPDQLLALARTLFGYVAAAEMVGMDHGTTCTNGQTWRDFLETIRTESVGSHGRWRTLEYTSANTANNWGAYALSSHLAVSIALDDHEAIARDTEIFRRFLGDPTSTAGAFQPTAGYTHDGNGATWDMSPTLRAGINPADPNDRRSGALIEDALRGSDAPSVRCCTVQSSGVTYQEETLDALVAITQVLRTHGIDLRDNSDQALRRAYEFMVDNGGPGPYSLTRYLPYAVNHLYGTSFSTESESRPHRHLGYGSWLFTP